MFLKKILFFMLFNSIKLNNSLEILILNLPKKNYVDSLMDCLIYNTNIKIVEFTDKPLFSYKNLDKCFMRKLTYINKLLY